VRASRRRGRAARTRHSGQCARQDARLDYLAMPLGPISGVPSSDVRRRPVRRMDESDLLQQFHGSTHTLRRVHQRMLVLDVQRVVIGNGRRLYTKSAQKVAPPGWSSPSVCNLKRANAVR
jgi:hypothetical protein